MTHFHRWSEWAIDYEEAPEGEMSTFEFRSRHCTRRGCDMTEEVARCVSLSPEVVRGLTR